MGDVLIANGEVDMNKVSRRALVVLIAFLLVLPVPVYGRIRRLAIPTVYYVAPSGNDNNPGTEGRPWRTINHAADEVGSGDTVIVKAGNYVERVRLDKHNSALTTFKAEGRAVTHGFEIYGHRYRVEGFECSSSRYSGGIRVGSSWDDDDGWYNEIIGNDIHHTEQDGIQFWGRYNLIAENYIHDIYDPALGQGPHADCFQSWNGVQDTIIERNWCEMSDIPINITKFVMMQRSTCSDYPVRNITFRNNVFVSLNERQEWTPMQLGNNACHAGCNMEDITVVNNTFVNRALMGDMAIIVRCCDGVTIKNNVMVNFDETVWLHRDYSNVDIGYNGVYNENGRRPDDGPRAGDVWMEDPRFVGEIDFHLQANSPLIDAGLALTDNDYDGVSRPQGAGHDMGAFEYSSGPQPTATPTLPATATSTGIPPTDTPEPTATDTPQPTDTPELTDTPEPTATWTSEPTATNTPEPTPTATPPPDCDLDRQRAWCVQCGETWDHDSFSGSYNCMWSFLVCVWDNAHVEDGDGDGTWTCPCGLCE